MCWQGNIFKIHVLDKTGIFSTLKRNPCLLLSSISNRHKRSLDVHQQTRKEGRKEMFYLTTHSTHFILLLYGIGYIVKDHSDNERGNLLLPHGLLFPISSKDSFICTIPDRIAHTTAFVTPVVEHWLKQEIAQWVSADRDKLMLSFTDYNLLHWL